MTGTLDYQIESDHEEENWCSSGPWLGHRYDPVGPNVGSLVILYVLKSTPNPTQTQTLNPKEVMLLQEPHVQRTK